MDYAEMVSQIMAAEQGAKVLAEESRARRQQLQAGLEQEPVLWTETARETGSWALSAA